MQSATIRPSVSAPRFVGAPKARRARVAICRAEGGDLKSYMSGALETIFSVTHPKDAAKFPVNEFEGRINHHDSARLSLVKRTLEDVKAHVEPAPEQTALELYEGDETTEGEGVMAYLSTAISRVFDHNFTGDSTEPDWTGTTVNFTGQIKSQRDIERMVAFEKVLDKTLEKAEEQ